MKADTCYNMNEPQTNYGKRKKPDRKGQKLYNFIYMKYLEQINP